MKNLLFYLTLIVSIAFIVITYVRLDFSFKNKNYFFIGEQTKKELIERRGFIEKKENNWVYVERNDEQTGREVYYVFQEKRSFINPLGSLVNYLAFDLFFFASLGFCMIFVLLQFINFRDITYLYYVGYVFCNVLYFIRHWAIGHRLGALVMFEGIGYYTGEALLSAAFMILYVIFIRSFIELEDKPAFRKTTNGIIVFSVFIGLLDIVLGLILKNDWHPLEMIYKIMLAPLISIAFIQIFNSHKKKLAVYIITGSLFLVFLAACTGMLGLFRNLSIIKWDSNLHIINQMFYFKVGVILEILCFAIGLGYRTKMIDDQKNELLKDNNTLLLRNNELLEDRLRMSRDLHEDLGGDLVSLKSTGDLILALKKQELWDDVIVWIERMIKKAGEATQKLSLFVSSTKLEDKTLHDLSLFIREHAFGLLVNQDVKINNSLEDDSMKKIPISGEYLYHVSMICKELITNIKKHAESTAVDIGMHLIEKGLNIIIADNGKGMPDDVINNEVEPGLLSGNGLKNMHERAQKINGKLNITSLEPSGVKVVLFIPQFS